MFDQFILEMIVIIMVLGLVIAFVAVKRNASKTNDITPPIIIKEESSRKPLQESKQVSKQEEIPVLDEQSNAITNRRKSDTLIPKRPVPPHEKITKQHFTEFSGERIMVAEDNPINQKVIMGLLGESGIELVMANDGQEALDILENDSNFVMILMDANMPRMDGFEATRIIRANPKYDHILIVALSGDTATDDIQKMKDAGMDEQLAKPLRMDSLYNVLYAYTSHDTAKNTRIASVHETKILNIGKGLETCGGDETFYREILSEFMDDYGDSSERLGNLLRFNNIYDADMLLLDIIGVSENIGAHVLGESASNLKLSLRDTDERTYFSLFDQYKAHFDTLVQEIKAYL